MMFVCQIVGAQSRLNGLERIDAITIDERIVAGKDADVTIDYYSGKSEVTGKTITYVIERGTRSRKSNLIFLKIYNKNNTLPEFPSLNGRELQGDALPFIPADKQVIESIVRSCIPSSKLNTLSYYGGGIWIIMRSDPKTGRVLEVVFRIHTNTNQKKDPKMISPEELEKIENAIKTKVVYSVPDKYKEHEFIRTSCDVTFLPELNISQ